MPSSEDHPSVIIEAAKPNGTNKIFAIIVAILSFILLTGSMAAGGVLFLWDKTDKTKDFAVTLVKEHVTDTRYIAEDLNKSKERILLIERNMELQMMILQDVRTEQKEISKKLEVIKINTYKTE